MSFVWEVNGKLINEDIFPNYEKSFGNIYHTMKGNCCRPYLHRLLVNYSAFVGIFIFLKINYQKKRNYKQF